LPIIFYAQRLSGSSWEKLVGNKTMVIIKGLLLPLLLCLALFCFHPGCSDSQKDSLRRVKSAGQINLGMSSDYPPFSFYNDKGELDGFDVDVAREIAKRLGVKLNLVVRAWSGIIDGLLDGSYDAILGSMAITEDRKKIVAFSSPYYHSSVQLMIRKGAPFKDLKDLKGKIIGIEAGSNYVDDAKALGVTDIRLFEPGTKALLELSKGNLDGVIVDQIVGVNAITLGNYEIEFLGGPLRRETVGIAFRKEDKALVEEVNRILEGMQKHGFLRQLSAKVSRCEYKCF
jgi:polar amino acid transport system substrate-binding protein